MSFRPNALFYTDGYKPGHKRMLAPGTTREYGTWIPRTLKYAPKDVKKIVSFGQGMLVRWIHDIYQENFFSLSRDEAMEFVQDMCLYLRMEYDGEHFGELYDLGYLPIRIKSLPEGIETVPNIPHMTFINTVDGFAWLTLYLETIISSLAWKPSTSATLALQYKRNLYNWVMRTDPDNAWLIPYLAHDFSARGLDPFSMLSSGLGHATSFRGSDTMIVIPGARYYYGEPKGQVCINSVNASEHSVTCTGIFYYQEKLKSGSLNYEIEKYYSFDIPCDGSIDNPDYLAIAEWLNLRDWLHKFPKSILSYVCDTFNTWKLITYILPRLKDEIMSRDGKLVIRPDSGDPIDIICGNITLNEEDGEKFEYVLFNDKNNPRTPEQKGVIELLYDIFGGITNEQGYKVLDSHIGAIYGDSITLDRQIQIYERLANKQFASTNIVLGVGSFTYQYNTRDTFGWAAKGAWFETKEMLYHEDGQINMEIVKSFNIYKDPITDRDANGQSTKKSLKGLQAVFQDENGEYYVKSECTWEEENTGLLQTIYEDGSFYNETTLTEIRAKIDLLCQK